MVDGALLRGDVEVDAGVIARVGIGGTAGTGLAVPGLVDLQVNGYAGIDVLDAELDVFEGQARQVQSRADTLLSLVAVYKAMGGGWDEPLAKNEIEP